MPHKPLQTYDRKMKRFVTASESKAVTADGISNIILFIYGNVIRAVAIGFIGRT